MTTVGLLLLFSSVSNQYALPEGLLSAICYTESRHKPKAVNLKDGLLRNGERSYDPSVGMCQIKEATARQYEPFVTHKELMDPKVNVRIAGKILRRNLERYRGDVPCAVAAYNAGSCTFNKNRQIKNRKYVAKVLMAWLDGK